MVCGLTTELSDAGGPARPHWQLTWPARVRSSGFVRLFGDRSCLLLDTYNVQTAQGHAALVVKPHNDATPARIDPSVLRARNSITVTAAGHNNERLERARCQMLANIFNHRVPTLRLRLDPGKPSRWLETRTQRKSPNDQAQRPPGQRRWSARSVLCFPNR